MTSTLILAASVALAPLPVLPQVTSLQVDASQPRVELPSPALRLPADTSFPMERAMLIVKFRDGIRARASAAGELSATGLGRFNDETEAFLADANDLRFRSLIQTPTSQLESLLARAAERSGRAQPDLAGLMRVEFPSVPDRDTFLAVGEALRALPDVEFVTGMDALPPPPEDYAPMTPDLSGNQGYTGADPGLDYAALWAMGADGSGLRFSDCEYGWDGEHEDLVDLGVTFEAGQTVSPFVAANGWDDHGTAVLGINNAPHNDYGVDGAAEGAEVFVFPENTVEEGSRRVTCIVNALSNSRPGDVVLLEMQTGFSGPLAPAEVNPAVWMATRVGVDAGVIVVAAAGNGNANLDSNGFANYRALGDSGAIIVGAGTASLSHDKLNFSSHGARVDVQAWGRNVFTTGYGSFTSYGGDDRQSYTSSFSGTSSASALIAGAVVLIQDHATNLGYPLLSSQGMRALLKVGAIPQGSGNNIGPFPNLAAIRDELECGGANYCFAAANEGFAAGAFMGSQGEPSLSGADITLTIESATPMSIGYFVMGGAPGLSSVAGGFLCIQPGSLSLFRLLPPISLDAAGAASRSFPFDSSPGSLLAPGDLGYFQFWYRDPNGPHGESSNFSDARAIRFCP
ncbi:MAG: S8 family serine peptidase [Planctomycetota bacterium]